MAWRRLVRRFRGGRHGFARTVHRCAAEWVALWMRRLRVVEVRRELAVRSTGSCTYAACTLQTLREIRDADRHDRWRLDFAHTPDDRRPRIAGSAGRLILAPFTTGRRLRILPVSDMSRWRGPPIVTMVAATWRFHELVLPHRANRRH
jgi:hypothetical protein